MRTHTLCGHSTKPGMGKKRKSVASRLDEGDRSMYAAFCSAANSLSQLYTHAMNQQKLSFQAGERHALEKLCEWILKQQEGSRLTASDIFSHLQIELKYGEDLFISQASQKQSPCTSMCFTNISNQAAPALLGQATNFCSGQQDQVKSSIFCDAQPYQTEDVSSFDTHRTLHAGNQSQVIGVKENLYAGAPSFYDSAVDMQSDSPILQLY